jgi:hypothetical protein
MILPAMFDAVLRYTRLNGLCVIATVSMVSNVPRIIAYKRPQRTFQSQNYVASCRHGAGHQLARAGDWGKCLTYRLDSLIVIGHHDSRGRLVATVMRTTHSVVCRRKCGCSENNGNERQPGCRVSFSPVLLVVGSSLATATSPLRGSQRSGCDPRRATNRASTHARTQCPGHASLPQACHWTHTSLERGHHRRPAALISRSRHGGKPSGSDWPDGSRHCG